MLTVNNYGGQKKIRGTLQSSSVRRTKPVIVNFPSVDTGKVHTRVFRPHPRWKGRETTPTTSGSSTPLGGGRRRVPSVSRVSGGSTGHDLPMEFVPCLNNTLLLRETPTNNNVVLDVIGVKKGICGRCKGRTEKRPPTIRQWV